MTIKKLSICFVFILLFVSLISVSYSFPIVELDANNYPSGEVIISGEASSGIELSLFVNDNYVSKIDLVENATMIYLTGSISDYQVSRSSKLTFMNNNSEKNYTLSIAGHGRRTLNYGETFDFSLPETGDSELVEENDGTRKVISVRDKLLPFVFDGINQNDFVHGDNTLRFVAKSLRDKTELETFEQIINYEKYSNTITLSNFVNITDDDEVVLMGSVEDSSYPLFYVLNNDVIGNVGLLNSIELDGNRFNKTIGGLREGVNSIRLITTEADNRNIFNGEKIVEVISDTIRPRFDITGYNFRSNVDNSMRVFREDNTFFMNENNIILNVSTDASVLNYTLNGENNSVGLDVSLDYHEVDLRLENGQNNVTFNAYDTAGNLHREAHIFIVDREKPKLLKGTLDPQPGSEVHFPIIPLEGKVNKPDVELTVFTIPTDAKDREGRRITCSRYDGSSLFVRNLGQLDRDRVWGPELNLNETQISLLEAIPNKRTVKSNSTGNFTVLVSLHERSFDRRDYNDGTNAAEQTTNDRVRDVKSQNKVCFVMADRFGNVRAEEISLTLDAGNTLWRVEEVTSIPNSVYAGEIEQTGDIRSGTGRVEVGLTVRLRHIDSSSKVTRISSYNIRRDSRAYEDSRHINVIGGVRKNFLLDKDAGELIIYFPVELIPRNIDPLEYPSELDLGFAIHLTYAVDTIDVPIDTVNPVYFQTKINIERPLDHTRWLTPNTINGIQEFLNTTIKYTEKFSNAMRWATIGGIAVCTVAKFKHAAETVQLNAPGGACNGGDPSECDEKRGEIDWKLYWICDRVVSTAAPYECGLRDDQNFLPRDKYILGVEYEDGSGNTVGSFDPRVSGRCDPDGKGPLTEDDGVNVAGRGVRYKEGTSYGIQRTIEEEVVIPPQCLRVNDEGEVILESWKVIFAITQKPPILMPRDVIFSEWEMILIIVIILMLLMKEGTE